MIHQVTKTDSPKWPHIYPWDALDVGDVFQLPESISKHTKKDLVTNANKRLGKLGRKFASAKGWVIRIK